MGAPALLGVAGTATVGVFMYGKGRMSLRFLIENISIGVTNYDHLSRLRVRPVGNSALVCCICCNSKPH